MAAKPTSLKDKIAIVASVVALAISIFAFFRDNFLSQHVLRASVVAVGNFVTDPYVDILLVNPGKHYETLYKARLIVANDLTKGGGELSPEFIGPIVLEAGKAVAVRLRSSPLNLDALRNRGFVEGENGRLHVGVDFEVVTPKGELTEHDKVYRVTELMVEGDHLVGAKSGTTDNNGFIDLL